jgi:hypothetical protein
VDEAVALLFRPYHLGQKESDSTDLNTSMVREQLTWLREGDEHFEGIAWIRGISMQLEPAAFPSTRTRAARAVAQLHMSIRQYHERVRLARIAAWEQVQHSRTATAIAHYLQQKERWAAEKCIQRMELAACYQSDSRQVAQRFLD